MARFRFRKCMQGRIHYGWYIDNVRDSSGIVVCLRRNNVDGKWRIANDPRPFETREKAARAAFEMHGAHNG